MRLFTLMLFIACLFAVSTNYAQKRPVGYIDKSVVDKFKTDKSVMEHRIRIEQSLTVLNNKKKILPIKNVGKGNLAAVSLVSSEEYNITSGKKRQRYNSFLSHVSNYASVQLYVIPKDTTSATFVELQEELKDVPLVIVGLHSISNDPMDNYGITDQALQFIQTLSKSHKVVLSYFGNIKGLRLFAEVSNPLLWSPADDDVSRSLAAQLIFGAIPAQGELLENINPFLRKGMGAMYPAVKRLKFTVPEEFGINSYRLRAVDSIVAHGMAAKAFPGAVVMAAKNGKVFYWKAFGNHLYEVQNAWQKMHKTDVFDLASITKISATLLATMKLQEEGKIGLNSTFGHYVPEARSTNKNDILVKELLTHQAGLVPYIPFWKEAIEIPGTFSSDSSAEYPFRVAEGMYIKKGYFKNSMWQEMLNTSLKSRGRYVYSDLSMYFMQAIVENVSGTPLEKYVAQNFYQPMGLSTMGFQPRRRIPLRRIVPTENDQTFRMQLLRGDVHDQGAAMAGGVAGHAGLFSNSRDLMVVGQMLLNGGEYGGKRYLKEETVKLFNTRPYPNNHRALGFNKPDPDRENDLVAESVPIETFGHTGFTGTCIWVDPVNDIVYVFLSNRVNPYAYNNTYSRMNIRERIQQVFYDAFGL